MSLADRSTSTSRPRMVWVPLMAAPIRYGMTVNSHSSLAGCAADVAGSAQDINRANTTIDDTRNMNGSLNSGPVLHPCRHEGPA